jgi:hypothetical protein
MGSFKLWIEFQKTNEHRHTEFTEIITELNIANQENIQDIEDNENIEEEDEVITMVSEDLVSETTTPEVLNQNEAIETDETIRQTHTPISGNSEV